VTLITTALVIALLSIGLTLLKIRRDIADAALGSSLLTVGGMVLISMMLADTRALVLFLGASRLMAFYVPLILGLLLAIFGAWLTFSFVRRYRKHRADIERRLATEIS
jgi:hypothetical protein